MRPYILPCPKIILHAGCARPLNSCRSLVCRSSPPLLHSLLLWQESWCLIPQDMWRRLLPPCEAGRPDMNTRRRTAQVCTLALTLGSCMLAGFAPNSPVLTRKEGDGTTVHPRNDNDNVCEYDWRLAAGVLTDPTATLPPRPRRETRVPIHA